MIEEKGWMYQITEESDYPSFFYKNKVGNNFVYISFVFNRIYNKILFILFLPILVEKEML